MVHGSPPARRATSTGQEGHVMTERKRREKINGRLIELSTIIPGLKKLNRGTILADATRYVEELQQKIKALQEAAPGHNSTSLVKNLCYDPPSSSSSSSSSSGAPAGCGSNPRPEIEVQLSEKGVTLRIICGDAKGVVVRALSEVEGLHLSITHANTMRSSACTLIITITAEVDEGFTLTPEEIIGRLNSALEQHSTCTSTEVN